MARIHKICYYAAIILNDGHWVPIHVPFQFKASGFTPNFKTITYRKANKTIGFIFLKKKALIFGKIYFDYNNKAMAS